MFFLLLRVACELMAFVSFIYYCLRNKRIVAWSPKPMLVQASARVEAAASLGARGLHRIAHA